MPAGSLSGARTRSRPRPGPRARCRWWSVTAVPHAATPTVSPAPAWVTARASHGPFGQDDGGDGCGSGSPVGRCWVPNSSRDLSYRALAGVLRYLGASGCPVVSRAVNPTTPSWSWIGKVIRARNRSISRPLPGGDRDPGGEQVGVGVSAGAQVVDQAGPRCRGVPDPVPEGFGGGVPAGGDRLGEHRLRGLGLEPGLRVEQDDSQPVAVGVQGGGQPLAGRVRGARGRLRLGHPGLGVGGQPGDRRGVGGGGRVGGCDQGPGGAQDPGGGCGDRLVVAPGPGGDVREAVVGGVQAVVGGDQVGHALGLDLDQPSARRPLGQRVQRVVEQDVPRFMGQRLARHQVVDVGAHGHGAGAVVGEPVGPPNVRRGRAPGDGEPAGGDHLVQGIPQPGGCLTFQQYRAGWGGDRVPVGRGDVKDRDAFEPVHTPAGSGLGAVRGPGRGAGGLGPAQVVGVQGPARIGARPAGGHRGQNPQRLLALADLTAHRRPRLIPRNGSRGPLDRE